MPKKANWRGVKKNVDQFFTWNIPDDNDGEVAI